jgi:hypothetical protein
MDGKFIIEEFKQYKVFLYGQKFAGEQTDYGIDLSLPSGKAYLRFLNNFMKDNYVETHGNKNYYHIFLRADKYSAFIDILRYEQPLFFYYNFDNDSFYLTTSDEPVGESEVLLNKIAGRESY